MSAILMLIPGWFLVNFFFAATPTGQMLLPIWYIANLFFGIWLMKNYKSARIAVPVVIALWFFAPTILQGISYFALVLIYWFLIRD